VYGFEVADDGALLNSARNVEALRRLWLDHDLIVGDDLGPGDRGDFDVGAWHVGCHLVAAGGVRRAADGRLLWLELAHNPVRDGYFASVTAEMNGGSHTLCIDTAEARALLEGSTLLGFVEGNSAGRISARGVLDSTDRFNLWRRQDFDQPPTSDVEGGRVWEHWCTLRDVRASSAMGSGVLAGYVSLVSALGDRFPPTVARGRTEYGHPTQLAALVHAGFCTREAALWNITPLPIPTACEHLLQSGESAQALTAAGLMQWNRTPRYYMYRRKLAKWNGAPGVRAALAAFANNLEE